MFTLALLIGVVMLLLPRQVSLDGHTVGGTMTSTSSKRWLILLACAFLLSVGIPFVSSAQDSIPTPTNVAGSGVEAVATQAAEATPVVQDGIPIPTATAGSGVEAVATTAAEGTPVAQTVASGALSSLSEMTAQDLLVLAISLLLVVLAVIYGNKLVADLLRLITRRTATTLDDTLLEALRPQIRWLIAAIGFQIVTVQLKFITGFWKYLLQGTYFFLYWSVSMATVWRAIDYSAHWYIEKLGPDIDPNVRDQLLPLGIRLGHLFLVLFGIGILLSHFGVNLLAVGGVLGLTGFAISLAAKDTITNIISGIVIMFDAPFKIGDRVDIPALGTWGDVQEIGMRSTRVVTRDNRLVIIPNGLVVDSQVVNYSQPDPTYRLQVDLGIGTSMNVPWVKQVLEDAVRGVDGVLADKPVQVLFTGFGASSNTFRARWWVATPGEKRASVDSVCAAIQKTADEKGIDMPVPIYSLDNRVKISQEDAAALPKAPTAGS
jgi:MscS family membrane protein